MRVGKKQKGGAAGSKEYSACVKACPQGRGEETDKCHTKCREEEVKRREGRKAFDPNHQHYLMSQSMGVGGGKKRKKSKHVSKKRTKRRTHKKRSNKKSRKSKKLRRSRKRRGGAPAAGVFYQVHQATMQDIPICHQDHPYAEKLTEIKNNPDFERYNYQMQVKANGEKCIVIQPINMHPSQYNQHTYPLHSDDIRRKPTKSATSVMHMEA